MFYLILKIHLKISGHQILHEERITQSDTLPVGFSEHFTDLCKWIKSIVNITNLKMLQWVICKIMLLRIMCWVNWIGHKSIPNIMIKEFWFTMIFTDLKIIVVEIFLFKLKKNLQKKVYFFKYKEMFNL